MAAVMTRHDSIERAQSHDTADKVRALVHPPDWRNPNPAAKYDLLVLGGGTAGLVSAMGAAGLGARVALVERHLLGGDCLNTGCVPSKAIIRSARASGELRRAAALGVNRTEFIGGLILREDGPHGTTQ